MSMDFEAGYSQLRGMLLTQAEDVSVGEWHAQDVSDQPLLVTRELINTVVAYEVPRFVATLQEQIRPNMPFAEAQFSDRVSGKPLNPPPSAPLWPYNNEGHKAHLEKEGGKFSHTYPERFWPKSAGSGEHGRKAKWTMRGIRYRYGDLNDVVRMLAESPYTRQAYLPVWFPEDTGNRGVRLPCTLGYHFLLRKNRLNLTYFIRSVDFVRHFRDDVYMACRLMQWMLNQLQPTAAQEETEIGESQSLWSQVTTGQLVMHIVSLHCMWGDIPMMKREHESYQS